MKNVEHIGIAVKSLEISIPLYEKLLNTTCYKIEEIESEGVKTAFFKTGETKIELLQATHEKSVIHKYIEKNGEGIHHLAFNVENIELEIDRLRNDGYKLINESPKIGADGKKICFLHPKSTQGVLIELCEDIYKANE